MICDVCLCERNIGTALSAEHFKDDRIIQIIEVCLEGEESAAKCRFPSPYRLLKFAWAITQGDCLSAEPPATLMPYNYTMASVLKL